MIEYFKIPEVCPVCGSPTKIECKVTSEILVCTNPECNGSLVNRIEHFGSKKAMNIKGLSKATIEKLIDWGWVEKLADLYRLQERRDEWIKKPGFGPKSVDNILNAIEDSREPEFKDFLCGIGIPFVGKTLSAEIAKVFVDWDSFRNAVDTEYDFTAIDKIADEKNAAIHNFNYEEADYAAEWLYGFRAVSQAETANSLEGEVFCITGKLNNYTRDSITELIQSLGGKVTSSVTKNTTWLVTNTPNSGTSKNVAAQRLSIPIITELEFENLLPPKK